MAILFVLGHSGCFLPGNCPWSGGKSIAALPLKNFGFSSPTKKSPGGEKWPLKKETFIPLQIKSLEGDTLSGPYYKVTSLVSTSRLDPVGFKPSALICCLWN